MRRVGSLIIDARRNALRTRRRMGLAVATALTVGVSCGVGTSALLGLERVVFGSLPYPDADRLVYIRTIDRFDPSVSERVTGEELIEWKERSRLIESFGGSEPPRVGGVVGDESGPLVRLAWVTSDLFTTLGLKPFIGSVFTGPRTRETQWQLILGYRMWQRYFAGDPAAIGKSMRFTGLAQSWTVIGVMPPAFEFPEGVDGWIPTWSMGLNQAGRREVKAPSVLLFRRLLDQPQPVFAAVGELHVDRFLFQRERNRLADADLAFEVRAGDRHYRFELQPQLGRLDHIRADFRRPVRRGGDADGIRAPDFARTAADSVVALPSRVDERAFLPLTLDAGRHGDGRERQQGHHDDPENTQAHRLPATSHCCSGQMHGSDRPKRSCRRVLARRAAFTSASGLASP
jgi:hypothetical protein